MEKLEKEPKEPNFLNFFELSEAQLRLLQERVEKSNGLVRIFVHPYIVSKGQEMPEKDQKMFDAMDRSIRRILNISDEGRPPLLIFEERSKVEKLTRELSEVGSGRTYIVPTFDASPEPKPEEHSVNSSRDIGSNWSLLVQKFKQVGIKKAIIGGMFFSVKVKKYDTSKDASPEKAKIDMDLCVGRIAKILSRQFTIEISNLGWPMSRKEYREAGKTVKELNR